MAIQPSEAPAPSLKAAKPLICRMSTLSGVALALVTAAFSAAGRPVIEGPVDVLFFLGFALWVGLPLLILGQIKVFTRFPAVLVVLYVIGCCWLTLLLFSVFVKPAGSNAGLALITCPLILTVFYAIAAVVLSFSKQKVAHGAKHEPD